MFQVVASLVGWAILLFVAGPALWTGFGAMTRPPHEGARARGLGIVTVGLIQAGIGAWILVGLTSA